MRRRKTQNYNTVGGDAEKAAGEEQGADASGGNGADGANGAGPTDDAGVDDAAGGPAAAPDIGGPEATPAERIAALQAERDDFKDRMLRIAADFENWKKRARKSETDAVTEARERVLKDMLEVVDNLERAVGMQAAGGNGAADGSAVLKGVDLVLRVLKQKLERHDVKAFEAAGQPFDPRVHEAISRVASADVPAGNVAVELQKGYRLGERLLRPALVSVSSGPA